MNIQEVLKTVENFQGNVSAGIVVALYYLIVYWPRIKDGLGLSRSQKYDLDRMEKNYQLLKLRIEIEQIKKNSSLDSKLLERLEYEMQASLEEKKGKPFTTAQKFIAIPLIIIVIILGFIELQEINQESSNTSIDVLSGGVFVITTIIVGFWGIPILQACQKGWLRKTGFIIFWTFGFYIISYFLIFVFAKTILEIKELAGSTLRLIFLSSIVCSLIIGMMGRLPFMRLVSKKCD